MIIPVLVFIPTFGQAAGESSTPANYYQPASKAVSVQVVRLSFSNVLLKKHAHQKKVKITKKSTNPSKESANSSKSNTSSKPTTSNTNTAQHQTNTNQSTSHPTTPATSSGTSNSNPTTTSPSPSNSDVLPIEREVVRLVNAERAKQGLKPLELDSKLSSVARKKSQDMRDNNYFSHQSPTYGSPFDMLKQFGVSYRTAGENIAAGYPSAQAVVTGWMNSAGHRANILNPSFTKIGVGYVAGGKYGSYWTQLFTG